MKRILLVIVLCLCALHMASATTYMTVCRLSGSNYVSEVSKLGRLEFASGKMTLLLKSGQKVDLGAVSNTHSIVFGAKTQAVEVVADDAVNVSVYPTRVSQRIHVHGATEGEPIRIFSIGGTLLQSAEAQSSTTEIDLGGLPKGIYIVLVEGRGFKIMKQ